MRFVPVKSVESQDIVALHRVRSALVKARTAEVNRLRGLLASTGSSLVRAWPRYASACRKSWKTARTD